MEEQEEYDEDVEVIEEDLFHQQVGRKLFIVFQASIGAQCGFWVVEYEWIATS